MKILKRRRIRNPKRGQCHILREDGEITYCGRAWPMSHGGLATADCLTCLKVKAALDLRELVADLKSENRIVRQAALYTFRRLRRLGVVKKAVETEEKRRK